MKLLFFMTILVTVGCSSIGKKQTPSNKLMSASVLHFNESGVLFVGDSSQGKLWAFETNEIKKPSNGAFNLKGIDKKIGQILNLSKENFKVSDLAVHPHSHNAYMAVTTREEGQKRVFILKANQTGKIDLVNIDSLPSSSVNIISPASKEIRFWKKDTARSLTITDIDFHNGEVYISGLMNAEFSSVLRKVSYPFKNNMEVSKIEMFHSVHNMNETRAPIRTMAIRKLNGKDHIIAAYTCTPVVSIPLAKLNSKKIVKAKTLSEIGYGNTPIDLITLTAYNMKQQPEDFILVTNKERGAALYKVSDLEASNKKAGLSSANLVRGQDQQGAKYRSLPMAGVMHLSDQDNQYILSIRRNMDNGDLDLLSFRKAAYFRLSDFISEYEFPSHDHDKSKTQQFFKNFQNMLKADEGYSDLLHE